jgi:hypothetical protein
VRISDRLTSRPRDATELKDRLGVVGRFIVEGSSEITPDCYVAGVSSTGPTRVRGGGMSSVHGPSAVTRAALSAVAAAVDNASWDLAVVPPLALHGSAASSDPVLERLLEKHLPDLKKVMERPYRRLRSEGAVVPVEQARRITAATARHLAEHSETWGRRSVSGVRPIRVLSQRVEGEIDIYENRFVVDVLRRLDPMTSRRLRELRDLRSFEDALRRAASRLQDRPWRATAELAARIAEAVGQTRGSTTRQSEALIADIRRKLLKLLGNPLTREVSRLPPGSVPHSTNLLSDDPRYRSALRLWHDMHELEQEAPEEEQRAMQKACHEHALFCAVLLAHAAGAVTGARSDSALRRGTISTWRKAEQLAISIGWMDDDTFVVEAADEKVRIVPLAHDLAAGPDALPQLLLRELGAAKTWPTVVLYLTTPATEDARRALPVLDQLPHEEGRRAGLAPVGPMEPDSVGRVTRALRMLAVQALSSHYPVSVSLPIGVTEALARESVPAFRSSGRDLRIVAPLDGQRRQRLERLRPTGAVKGFASNSQPEVKGWTSLFQAISESDALFAQLSECPACGADALDSFAARDNGTYWCTCTGCGASWGTRTCECGVTVPAVVPPGVVPLPDERPSGWITDLFGSECLAAPCWADPEARYFICPRCGGCAAGQREHESCVRCSGTALPTAPRG